MRHSGRLDAALTTTVSHRKLVTSTGLPDAHYIASTSQRKRYLLIHYLKQARPDCRWIIYIKYTHYRIIGLSEMYYFKYKLLSGNLL